MNFKEIAVFFKFTGQQLQVFFFTFCNYYSVAIDLFYPSYKSFRKKEEWISLQTEMIL
jgi:hypothetical protein